MISKPTQLISICSTVNKQLQGTQTGDRYPLKGISGLVIMTYSETILQYGTN